MYSSYVFHFSSHVHSCIDSLSIYGNKSSPQKNPINCVFVYLDDIFIAISNPHQHIEDLPIVCGRLKQFDLTIRLDKCIFGVSEIDFLGYAICKNDSIPIPTKVKPISGFSHAIIRIMMKKNILMYMAILGRLKLNGSSLYTRFNAAVQRLYLL